MGLNSFSANVRFLFSGLVDTTCGESVEERQKRGVEWSEAGAQKLV